MNSNDFLYYFNRFKEDPRRLLKIVTLRNSRLILFHLPFEPGIEEFLKKTVEITKDELNYFEKGLLNSSLRAKLKKRYFEVRGKRLLSLQNWHKFIYLIIRKTKPKVVVETGVFDGISSAFILQALEDNKQGLLYSVDFPARKEIKDSTEGMLDTSLPAGLNPGWLVPDKLGKRWRFYLGPSKEQLPRVLKRIEQIDIFIHDSDHSYENMYWEFQTAWVKLKKGGLLCADDVFWNNAFREFCQKEGKKVIQKGAFGVIVR